jgi:tetratricopeptide (TPR) repeat protein
MMPLGTDFFSFGDLRRTLLASLLKDAAESNEASIETVDDFLTQPFFAGGVDQDFLRRFYEDIQPNVDHMRPNVVMRYAELGYQLARRHSDDTALEYLAILVSNAMGADSLTFGVPYAEEGLKELADESKPELMARLAAFLGQVEYDRRSFRSASIHFERAISYDRAARDRPEELRHLTALVACHTLLRNELEAIRRASEAEQIALELGDLHALTKTLGDRANAEFLLKRFDRAQKCFELALETAEQCGARQPQSDWLGMLGNVWLTQGNFEKAETYHRRALEISLETGNLESEQADHYNLGQVLWIQERYEESIEHGAAALRLAEKRADLANTDRYRQSLREKYLALGLHEQAYALEKLEQSEQAQDEQSASAGVEQLQQALAEPDTEELWEREFSDKMRKRDFPAAEAMVKAYISDHPDDYEAYFRLGLFLNETGQYEESISAYDEALARNPLSEPAHYNRLNSYLSIRDLETPRRIYERQRQNSPYDPIPRLMLGRIAQALGEMEEGVRELREAHRLAPQSFTIHSALCEALLHLSLSLLRDDFDGAWAMYEICLDELGRLIENHSEMRGDAYLTAGESNEKMAMQSHFEQPPLDGDFGDAELQVLGHSLYYYARAKELLPQMHRPRVGFERVLEILSQFAEAPELTRVASILRQTNFVEETMIFLQLSLEKDSNNPDTYHQLALFYIDQSSDNPDVLNDARYCVMRALDLDPSNEGYKGTLRRVGRSPRS